MSIDRWGGDCRHLALFDEVDEVRPHRVHRRRMQCAIHVRIERCHNLARRAAALPHLLENRLLVSLNPTDWDYLPIRRQDILNEIQQGMSSWERFVPPPIAAVIKRDGLFGYKAA